MCIQLLVSLSLFWGILVGERENFSDHVVSRLVLMVLYMYVMEVMNEFRFSDFFSLYILLSLTVYLV